MANRVVTPEQFMEASFPLAGNDASAEFWRQKTLTTPKGVNVRAQEPVGRNVRGGQRMGLVRLIDARVNGNHVIQMLNVVVDPQARALSEFSDSETGRSTDESFPDPSTNNDAAGLGDRVPTFPVRKIRTGGNGVSLKRPRPGVCTITTRNFTFDGDFSELLLVCQVQNCLEDGMGADPLDVVVEVEHNEYHFDWFGGGLPTDVFVNLSIATVTGNALTYCIGHVDTP